MAALPVSLFLDLSSFDQIVFYQSNDVQYCVWERLSGHSISYFLYQNWYWDYPFCLGRNSVFSSMVVLKLNEIFILFSNRPYLIVSTYQGNVKFWAIISVFRIFIYTINDTCYTVLHKWNTPFWVSCILRVEVEFRTFALKKNSTFF